MVVGLLLLAMLILDVLPEARGACAKGLIRTTNTAAAGCLCPIVGLQMHASSGTCEHYCLLTQSQG